MDFSKYCRRNFKCAKDNKQKFSLFKAKILFIQSKRLSLVALQQPRHIRNFTKFGRNFIYRLDGWMMMVIFVIFTRDLHLVEGPRQKKMCSTPGANKYTYIYWRLGAGSALQKKRNGRLYELKSVSKSIFEICI